MFILDNGLARRAKAKLRTSGGFSLPELLTTMLILLLMTAIATDGLPAVVRTYRKTVDIANAETYLNTTMIVLRNRLTLASNPKVDGRTLKYTDSEIGRCVICLGDKEQICVIRLRGDEEIGNGIMFMQMEMKEEGLIASYEADDDSSNPIEYNPSTGFFTIHNLQVKKTGENETLAKVDEYVVHTLNR